MMKTRLNLALIAIALPVLLSCRTLAASAAPPAGDACLAPDTADKAATAQSLATQKKYVDAEAPARAALGACPSQPVAAQALGESLVAQKKYDDAVAQMSAVISAKPDVAYAYLWRGYAYYNKRQPDRMVGDFETFLKLSPDAPEAAAVKQLLASLKK
jgi:tetratricopeptide (TPR) repeat protein